MRTTKLFATFLVAGLIVAGCKQDEDYVLPAITISTPTLDFSADTEQNVDLLATRDWQILGKPEWVQRIEPDHGPGTSTLQRIRLIVDPNDGYNREGEVVFTIGLAKSTLTLTQLGAKGEVPVGTGTKDDPYTVKGVLRYINTLGADVESPQDVYVKGMISEITEAFGTQYGNGSFKITGDEGEVFTVYRALYLGNKKWTANDIQIAVGDEVVICGKVVNYKGNTPETSANKSYVYSLNSKTEGSGGGGGGGTNTGTPSGTGTLADPYNAAGANAYIKTLAADAESDKDIYVKGKISRIAVDNNNNELFFSSQYGNASFYISDDGSKDGEFYVFRTLYLGNKKWVEGNTQIKVGDDVIICGKVVNYKGNTPETSANKSYIYSLNGTTDGGSGTGGNGGGNDGGGQSTDQGVNTPQTAYTIDKALEIINGLADGATSSEKYYIKGKISSVKEAFGTQYGNATFNISTDGTETNTVTAFRIKYFGGASYSDTSAKNIAVGDEVILFGPLQKYVDKDKNVIPETGSGTYLYSLNGATE